MKTFDTKSRKPAFKLSTLLICLVAISLLSIATVNAQQTFFALSAALVFVTMLYRVGEPPVLLFAVFIQWLQVTTKIFQADYLGIPTDDLRGHTGDVGLAAMVALVGLFFLTWGLRRGVKWHRLPDSSIAKAEAMKIQIGSVFIAYLVAFSLYYVFGSVSGAAAGLSQLFLAVFTVKWVFLFMLAYAVLTRRKGYLYLMLASVIEMLVGFGGFFSGFKTIFFILLIGGLSIRFRLSFLMTAFLGGLMVGLVYLCIWWSAVKIDYRDYVNEGSGAQVVLVPYSERMDFLYDSFVNMDEDDIEIGTQALLERVSYIDYFSLVLDYVPRVREHENGGLLGGAVTHIMMPRLFFPDKAAVASDSEMTNLYTGLSVGGVTMNTSISMGYMSDTYIDFGYVGMMVPIFMLGLLSGWMYGFIVKQKRTSLLLNYGIAVMVLINLATFETSLIKLLGGLITVFLVAMVLQKYLFPTLARRMGIAPSPNV
ncbi:MAG: hypothetical protein ACREPB_08410 [Arenimonas sp.]